MSLSRYIPIAFDDDLYRNFATDLQWMNQQMQRMNQNFQSMAPPEVYHAPPRLMPSSQMQAIRPPMDIQMNEAFRMDNPVITDKEGNKKFHLEFDLRQFKPEEINLTTANNMLTVHAKHEEKGDGRMSYREYNRQYSLPPGVAAETLTSKLRHDGVLSIEAPVEKRQDVVIPITHK